MEEKKTQIADNLLLYLEFMKGAGIDVIPASKPAKPSSLPTPIEAVKPPPEENIKMKPKNKSITSLEDIVAELGDCKRCKLSAGRNKIVFGEGDPKATILFIGEGPGKDEDEQGRPFVGRAGQLLTDIIEKGMKIKREEVYICNLVKCRPPENRNPEKDEIAACRPFLDKQIKSVSPKVIIALGKLASSTLAGREVKITQERGEWFDYEGIKVMPTYHPSYLLRNYTPTARKDVFEDVKKVLAYIG
ncbi:MAG: uracil-DNA glycosylase [Nitrospinota bacterium]|nr:uracil-DNA glycosylase [Nitrospinota bacterium]